VLTQVNKVKRYSMNSLTKSIWKTATIGNL